LWHDLGSCFRSQKDSAFLSELASGARSAKEIHIVLDNLSAHKTTAVFQLLTEHLKVKFTFTQHSPRG